VNTKVEILLTTVHVGSARRVVTIGFNGKDLAQAFLLSLAKSNREGFDMIRTRIKAVAERDDYENKDTFRHLHDGLYEFKRSGLRLYAFYDELPELKPQLIIATNGGTKNTKKEQSQDIAKALSIKQRYLALKTEANTKIKLSTLPNEY
jgi:hypothetical protein